MLVIFSFVASSSSGGLYTWRERERKKTRKDGKSWNTGIAVPTCKGKERAVGREGGRIETRKERKGENGTEKRGEYERKRELSFCLSLSLSRENE